MTGAGIHTDGDVHSSVQVVGSGNTVSLSIGDGHSISLIRRQIPPPVRAGGRQTELDILNPNRTPLPLLGRSDELAKLVTWAESDADISVHAVVGRAGSGKTRLAIELCRTLDGAGDPGAWLAGFLPALDLNAIADILATRSIRWDRPTLIVIDYASQAVEQLCRWLDRLVATTQDPKLRILLLEREAPPGPGWWHSLATSNSNTEAARIDLFTRDSPYTLPGLDTGNHRRAIMDWALQEALKLAATPQRPDGALGPVPTLPDASSNPDFEARLQSPIFANPLSLVMAGVLAADQGPVNALALHRLDAGRRLGGRELKRLEGAAPGGQKLAIRHIAAINCLTGGLPLAGLTATLRDELTAAGHAPGIAAELAVLLQQDFPSESGDTDQQHLATIQPDLIAEGAVIEAFDSTPEQQSSAADIVTRAYALTQERAAAALMRLLQDYAYAAEDPRATDAERQTAKRLVRWLTHLADSLPSPEDLEPLVFALPDSTLVLREEACALTKLLAEVFTSRHKTVQSESSAARAALWLNNLATRLSELGQREAALAAAQEAVGLYRSLAAARPDAFTPNLAASLNNLASFLSDLGQREAALAAAQEAVELRRSLAAARPDAFTPNLAMSLSNLANRLSELGQREAALVAAQEAVALYRSLAAARPDAFTPNLAGSLNNLASFLSGLGQREAALVAAQEAVALYRSLAAESPDAFTPDLAMSLSNLANRLSELGQREAALVAAQEAAELYRGLAAARPEVFDVDLSVSLGALTMVYIGMDNQQAGFATITEAIEVLSPRFLRSPQSVAQWMIMHLQNYFQLAEAVQQEPDGDLLAPILAIFEAMRKKEEGE